MATENGDRPIRQRVAETLVPPEMVERAIAAGMEQHRDEIVAEIVGRTVVGNAQTTLYKSRSYAKTVDETVPDYEFWDRLRRGKAHGFSLGGLFAPRIEQIFASWVLGRGVTVTLKDGGTRPGEGDPRSDTEQALADFLAANHAMLMQTYRDHLGLGDQYIIVNPDGTLSVPSPDTVEVERNPLDYREWTAVTVTTKLDDATIVDRYEPQTRTITTRRRTERGQMEENEETFDNLIGRIPVVHLAYGRSANETNGHPIHEMLRPLYDQYDDTIYKQLDGAKLLGNPIPTFEGMEDINEVIADNDPAEYDTYTDRDGNTATRTAVNLDQNTIVFVGKGGSFKFAAPPTGFTADTQQALKSLFLLLLDHTGIPEFIWGNEVASGRSSSEVQLTQWVRDIEGRQKNAEGWLLDLCDIWLLMQALVDDGLVLDALKAEWPPLIEEDEEIVLKRLAFAKDRNLLTDRTALELLHLVDDPQQEVEAAQAEAEERQAAMFPEGDTTMFQQRLMEDEDENE